MPGISVSAVTAYTAHREWASRPPDERFASVHALYEAARARRQRIEERTIDTGTSGPRRTTTMHSCYARRWVAPPLSRTGVSAARRPSPARRQTTFGRCPLRLHPVQSTTGSSGSS